MFSLKCHFPNHERFGKNNMYNLGGTAAPSVPQLDTYVYNEQNCKDAW